MFILFSKFLYFLLINLSNEQIQSAVNVQNLLLYQEYFISVEHWFNVLHAGWP